MTIIVARATLTIACAIKCLPGALSSPRQALFSAFPIISLLTSAEIIGENWHAAFVIAKQDIEQSLER